MKAGASLPFLDLSLGGYIRFATSNAVPCRQCWFLYMVSLMQTRVYHSAAIGWSQQMWLRTKGMEGPRGSFDCFTTT
jgi:hypothetical protein